MRLSRKIKTLRRFWRIKSKRLDVILLRLFNRFIPSESQRVFILTVLIGGLCGLAAVGFHLSIRFAESYLIERATAASGYTWIFWTIFTPTLGALIGGVLLQYVVPEARGSGIPQVKVAYAVKAGKLSFLNSSVGKFVISTIQIGSGASLGREGPTVQICCGIASLLGRAAALSRKNLKRMIPVGTAAGIAAAFNAPIAAVTFTIEEVVGDLDQTILSGVVVAAALAAAIERGVLGEHPVFSVPQGFGLHHLSSLILYAFLGIAAGFISLLFSESLLYLRKRFQRESRFPAWMRPAVGGLVTGILAVTALLWLQTEGITGGGYNTLSNALSGNLTLKVLLALCVMKLIATVFSYSSGGAGGIFAPALFIGATLGGAFGYFDVAIFSHEDIEIGAFALVGMGAVFAGIIRAPITSVLIIFEMTGSYGLILPLMLSNMISYVLARHLRPDSIYESLLHQDGIFLPENKESKMHSLEQLKVRDAMTTEPVSLFINEKIDKVLDREDLEDFSVYPVVDETNEFVGLISKARMRRTSAEEDEDQELRKLINQKGFITPGQPLLNAVIQMNRSHAGHLAVVDSLNSKKLIGILSMSDIIRVQAQIATDGDNPDSDSQDFSETTVLLKTAPPNQ